MTLSAARRQTVLLQSDNDNNNVLHAVAKCQNEDILRLLEEFPQHQPEDLFTKLLIQKNNFDRCCVLTACEYGNYRFLSIIGGLLETNADYLDTLLYRTIDVCPCEIEHEAECTSGYNMLMLALSTTALQQERESTVTWITEKLRNIGNLKLNADVLLHTNWAGNNALQVAVEAKAEHEIDLLLDVNMGEEAANTDDMITNINKKGWSSIFHALKKCYDDLVRTLLGKLSRSERNNVVRERIDLYYPRGNAEDSHLFRKGYNLIMMSLTLKDDLTAYHLLMEYDGYRQIEEDIDAMIVATQNEQWDAVHSIFERHKEEDYEELLTKKGLKENDGKELLSNWLKIDSIKRYLGSNLQDILESCEFSQAAAFAINSHYFPTKFFLPKRNKILKPLAIIFYNKFSDCNPRTSAEKEKDYIKEALVETGWNTDDIHVRDDWTFIDLHRLLNADLRDFYKKISFLFLCIMSHGEAGKIYGKDKAKDDEDMGTINKVLEIVGHRLHHDIPKVRYFIVIFF
ncbi:hypothetical protein EB796_017671 [Bugula neritina]|uniref:Uncharacterized protein n=1 Tax=Bugula neritina TaxID=10212 RepID=A0A7J7JCK9_BUGNE|nr:hypothetical protein EB796_017671 [Bugula neritina]